MNRSKISGRKRSTIDDDDWDFPTSYDPSLDESFEDFMKNRTILVKFIYFL